MMTFGRPLFKSTKTTWSWAKMWKGDWEYNVIPDGPEYKTGPRGGRYTIERSHDGGTYKRYR